MYENVFLLLTTLEVLHASFLELRRVVFMSPPPCIKTFLSNDPPLVLAPSEWRVCGHPRTTHPRTIDRESCSKFPVACVEQTCCRSPPQGMLSLLRGLSSRHKRIDFFFL